MGTICDFSFEQQLEIVESEVETLCRLVRHTEGIIHEKYENRIPTSPHRMRNFITKHISKLRSRDKIFQEYVNLCSLLDDAMNKAFGFLHS